MTQPRIMFSHTIMSEVDNTQQTFAANPSADARPQGSLAELVGGLRAVGETTRLRLVAVLAHGELNVSELTQVLGQSQPRISRHLKLMSDAGLLERHKEGSWVVFRIASTAAAGNWRAPSWRCCRATMRCSPATACGSAGCSRPGGASPWPISAPMPRNGTISARCMSPRKRSRPRWPG
jgi:DNA-binding transcriptional ArsR family regulator